MDGLQKINHLTNWRCLPWEKIYNRLYKLQANIYKASKECDRYKLSKLQQNLIDSSDVKVVAIQEISNYIYNNYLNFSQERYNLNDGDKIIIYKALYSNSVLDQYIHDIITQVKQYIILLCIQPELVARSESTSTVSYTSSLKQLNLNQEMYDLNINHIQNHIKTLMYIKKFVMDTKTFYNPTWLTIFISLYLQWYRFNWNIACNQFISQ